ncbi:hypothetical protein AA0119_g12762 [Alternaria tenuissima]|jgi:hypothetical protein|uniref:Uncharacterized protein n=1 Tax=Alternaria tenuissima TaxID=119927 RepID=A0A4Q4REB7_9PLEO|nr:hypothetical protein AA0115_g11359 [Alternaria tenuissima]RYN76825.1 hypothetical protein AA0120_g11626 [Alternaria tenuissima]RYN86581.1 hypothetical protein AA0119_g12762 [Alternaria tenuissima]RYO03599.1 hypothetical protein AA0121_g13001 [Alternaria tenuissima]RYO54981.1 hypothetical protein AA0116_g9290 [Alternaria tenuissima]
MPNNNSLVQSIGSRYDCILKYLPAISHDLTDHENEICQRCKDIDPHSLASLLNDTGRPAGATDMQKCQDAVRKNSEAQSEATNMCASRKWWFPNVKFDVAQKDLSEELIEAKRKINKASGDKNAEDNFNYTLCVPVTTGRPGEICNRCVFFKSAWMTWKENREMDSVFEPPVTGDTSGRILKADIRMGAGG